MITCFLQRYLRRDEGPRPKSWSHENWLINWFPGFIEDLVIGGEDEEDSPFRDSKKDFWSDFVETNYSELFTAFNVTNKADQEVFRELVSSAVARPKRQAQFPGTTRKENKNL